MFRDATVEDLTALRDLERAANLAALQHVFPPDRFPFPDDDVLARWALVLDEPGCEVIVGDLPGSGSGALLACAAYDATSLRHLAVHPDHWGEGVASRAVATAVAAIGRAGGREVSLWCLEENQRARRLYEHLGWRATADRQDAVWPPHPVELRYLRPVPDPAG